MSAHKTHTHKAANTPFLLQRRRNKSNLETYGYMVSRPVVWDKYQLISGSAQVKFVRLTGICVLYVSAMH